MNQDYLCTYLGHEREIILGFCMNLECQKKTQFCYKCVDINHSDHKNQCISFNQIHESIQSFQVIVKDWQQRIKTEFEKVQKEYLNISKFLQNELLNMIELDKILTNHQFYQFQQELPKFKKWSIISQAQVSRNNLINMLSELNQSMIAIKETKIEKLQNVEAKNSLNSTKSENILVYWDQQIKEFPITNAYMKLYQAIRGYLNLSDIVIYCNDQICSQSITIAEIFQNSQGSNQDFLFNVKKSPEVIEGEIKQLKVLIEKQKNEINDSSNKLKIFEENENKLNNQINELKKQVESLKKPTFSKRKSLGKNRVVNYEESGLIMDDQRKIVPQNFRLHLIQKKSQELDSLKIFQSLILGSTRNYCNSIEYSMVFEQQYACHFCNFLITEDIIQLSCQHFFHNQCFDYLLSGQISLGKPYFTCICTIKVKPKEIFSLSNKDAAEIYRLQMLQQQLKRIKDSSFEFFKCPKKYCTFFYKHDQNLPIQNSYCPACLE